VALYGSLIHAVVPDAKTHIQPIQQLLVEAGIHANDIQWIAPTLEDVFISSVKPRGD
jgi:hypothetical protein